MARFFTDFREEYRGEISRPSSLWQVIRGVANRTHSIEAAYPGQKMVINSGATGGQSFVGLKSTKNYDYTNTIESLTKFSISTGTQVPGSFGIVNHKYNASAQGLSLAFVPASSVKSIMLYDDKNGVTVNFANYNWASGTTYWVRYRQENTQHFVKIWPDGSAEPTGWTFSATYDIGTVSGDTYVGVGTYQASHTVQYYNFTVATNGDTAVPEYPPTGNYPNGYKYRKSITIDPTKVSAFGGHYRAMLLHTDADLKSVANGGKVELDPLVDIRFEDTAGVKLPHEIVEYDPATGAIEAWVRLGDDNTGASLSTTVGTTFYAYFGKKLTAETIYGIPVGYKSGFAAFQRNWDRVANTENQGEIAPFVSSLVSPSGAATIQPNDQIIAGREDGVLISGYVMYTEQDANARFGTPYNDHLVLVYYDGSSWYMDRNGDAQVPFTPVSTDFLVAAVSWGNTPASARSQNYISPLRAGEELMWSTWGITWTDDINVVGNTHRAVFHFNETPTSGPWVNNVASSDRFSMNMSGSGGPTSTAGKVGKAISYNGTNQKLRAPADVIWSTLGLGYISVWVRPSNLSHNGAIFARRENTSAANQLTIFNLSGAIRLDNGSFQWTTGYTLPAANQWYHIVWVANGTQHKLIVNGVVRATRNTTDAFNGSTGYNRVQFGASQTDAGNDGNWFNGQIDEFVLDTDNKADGFHVTTYNNQNSPSTFYSLGAVEQAVQINSITQTGNARIERSGSITQSGDARIEKSLQIVQQGNARIEKPLSITQLGNARIGRSGSITQQGNSRIERIGSITQIGNATLESFYVVGSVTQTGNARIERTQTITQQGNARIERTGQIVQQGSAFIEKQMQVVQTGNARIERVRQITQVGNATIIRVDSVTQIGNARIERISSIVQIGNATITNPSPDKRPQQWIDSDPEAPAAWTEEERMQQAWAPAEDKTEAAWENTEDQQPQQWSDSDKPQPTEWQRQYYD